MKKTEKMSAIGAFFTPLDWCEWTCSEFGIYDDWISGKTIFDPTAGIGNFLEALIALAVKNKVPLTDELLSRLYANEREKPFIADFMRRIKTKYNIDFPAQNFFSKDFVKDGVPLRVDIVVGNPPWKTFGDLSTKEKDISKTRFLEYGLVKSSRDVLLGRSRLDISALITAKAIVDNLVPQGKAYLFLPLSLFCGAGAYEHLHSWTSKGVLFAPTRIHRLTEVNVFPNVKTRYGVVEFGRDIAPNFPIPLFHHRNEEILNLQIDRLRYNDGPFIVGKNAEELNAFKAVLSKATETRVEKARQGVNTCGANDILIFEEKLDHDKETSEVVNRLGIHSILPSKFLYPLFSQNRKSGRWVLLPHDPKTGKPYSQEELEKYPLVWEYLKLHEKTLTNRKGVLIQAHIKKGFFWALLGVGSYTFTAYKVMWQAYGTDRLTPEIVDGNVQGNQALHSYIPCQTKEEAQKALDILSHPLFWKFLRMSSLPDSKSWAQGGKIMSAFGREE